MLKIFSTLLFTCAIFAFATAQDDIKTLFEKAEYKKIVQQFAGKPDKLAARDLYYVGLAYYMTSDDENCLKFLDLSIAKDPSYSGAHYYKATTLNYTEQYEEAIGSFNQAIKLGATGGESYSGLGDAYYNLEKMAPALDAYKKATEQKDAPTRAYTMIGQIYSETGENEKALAAFYVAKAKMTNKSESYNNTLYNIGLHELLLGNHTKAAPAFIEILDLVPGDYRAHAKLIQAYYGLKQYENAKPHRDIIYSAHAKGLLPKHMEKMYCFDQFKWKDKDIQAFETYQEGNSSEIYNKHLFYVVNSKGETLMRVQTEYSPFAAELGGPKYLLCSSKGNTHATYGFGFNDNFKYDDLKAAVLDILEEKVKPVATSTSKD